MTLRASLLALGLLALSGTDAFTTPRASSIAKLATNDALASSRYHRSAPKVVLSSQPDNNNESNDVNIDDVMKKTADALEAADSALLSNDDKAAAEAAYQDRLKAEAELAQAKARAKEQIKTLEEETKKRKLNPDEEKSAVAAGIGGGFLGFFLGGLAAAEIPDVDLVTEPIVLPIIGAVSLSLAGLLGGFSNGKLGDIIRATLGKATRALGKAIAAGIQAAIDGAVQSVQNKVKETTDDIKAFPGKVADAAVAQVEKTKDEIAQVPGKVKDAAIEKATEVAEEIKATPGRVVETTKQIVEDAVDDTIDAVEKAVDEVKAIPQKTVQSVENKVNEIVGKPPASLPPKTTPAKTDSKPPVSPPKSEQISAIPKLDIPKVEVPKIDIPKVNLPKLDIPKTPSPPKKPVPPKAPPKSEQKMGMPKLEIPKVEVPQISLPKVNLPTAPPKQPAPPKAAPRKAEEALRKAEEALQKSKAIAAAREAAELKRKEAAEAKRQREAEAKAKREEAAAEARRQAEEQRLKREEERKAAAIKRKEAAVAAAEAKRQRLEDLAQKRAEAAAEAQRKKEAAAEAKRKLEEQRTARATAAEKTVAKAAPGATISLGDLFGFGKNEEVEVSPQTSSQPLKTKAPPGVPTLNSWKQNNDGSITGRISGSLNFREGESITTSSVPKGAASGSVVKTSSGSRYFLGQPGGGGFSFGVGKPSAFAPSKPNEAAEAKKAAMAAAAEEKKAAAAALAEQRRQAAEERKAAMAAAAEERKAKAAAAAEERRQAAQEQKAAAAAVAERRRQEAEERKAAQAAAAQEKRAAAAAAAERRRQEAEKRKAAQAAAKGTAAKTAPSKATTKKAPPTIERPPRGVPVIKSWKKRRDGGVSGRIFGSPAFEDGDVVETSPITRGQLENGAVVFTSSGSRYFLSAEAATQKANIMAAIKDMTGAKPGSTITLTKLRKERDAKAATEAVKNAKPRPTFSLSGLGFGAKDKDLPPPSKKPPQAAKAAIPPKVAPQAAKAAIPPKVAPRGVPIMKRWKRNFDGSITGTISGSKTFKDGERVTTSTIAKGKIGKKEVVTTGSGSRYFLD